MRRIDRQNLIPGWDQAILDNYLIVNMGSGLASRYASLLSSCLEIGRIAIVNEERTGPDEFMGHKMRPGHAASQLEAIIKSLNNISVSSLPVSPLAQAVRQELGYAADCLFHSGNNYNEKRQIVSHLVNKVDPHDPESTKLAVILSAGNEHEIRVANFTGRIKPEYLMPQFDNQPQSTYSAIAQAAIGLGEVIVFGLSLGASLDEVLTYNWWSRKRTSFRNDFDWANLSPKGKKLAIVGLGAVGTMYLEAIYPEGFDTIYCYDDDTVDVTNLSRAPHYVGYEGKSKSESAASHFNKRGGRTLVAGTSARITEDSSLPEVDLIISAVDGFDNQMRLINYSQRNQIPLLLGGCTPFTSTIYTYVPGKTSSLLYQYDFLKQAYLSSIRKNHRHCTDPAVQGSNILTTALCASILAGETLNVFCNEPAIGPISYNMIANPKIGYVPFGSKRDLGKDIPKFSPLPVEAVTRTIDQEEVIHVHGKPFEEWYNSEGDILR